MINFATDMGKYDVKTYKAVKRLAKEKGFSHCEYVGDFQGVSVFLVSKGADGGKVGYPNYIGAKDGHVRLLNYEERKEVTFGSLQLPL